MNILTRKRRIIFFIFLALSVGIIIFFNVNDLLDAGDYTNRLNIICLIFFTALMFLLYIIFEAYRVMYEEMAERVNTITANKDELQIIYNGISLLLIEVNEGGIIINANDAVCRYLNKKKNHILGATIPKILLMEPAAIRIIMEMIDTAFKKENKMIDEFETDGHIFEVAVSFYENFADLEKKVLVVLNDVTQERANYRQMMQDNKMIAVGQLAAGVAHEIRNPLGLIRTYSHLLKKNPEDPEIREKAIPMIDYAVDRSSVIIDNLLGFSRLSSESREEIDLHSAVESIIKLEEHELLNRNISISVNCPVGIRFYTIAESLQIILVNLINNAIDAIEKDGSVSLSCNVGPEYVAIKVNDTGGGIPDKIKGDIFNPFFTTKENRNGSGLGLYIVYNEVMKLKGKIEVDSIMGEGTTFILTLPRQIGANNNE